MRKITALWGVLWMIIPVAFAQNIVTVSFTGNLSNGNWHPLDSVVVCDSLNGWSKTLVYDDTTLILHTANDINEEVFSTHSNIRCFPNPFVKQTSVEFYSASGTVQMLLFDMVGNQIAQWNGSVAAGIQSFSISTKRAQPYLLKIFTKDKVLSTKLICAQGGDADEIDFVENKLKFIPQIKLDCTEPFTLGDEMTYTGYSVQGTMPQSVTICHQQWNDELIPFVFPMVTPKYCPEHSTLQDVDGNSYSTVLIGKQCWMRENLKTAHYADGVALPIGNDTVHDHSIPFYFKYANSDSLAEIYGYLYSWTAAMRDRADTSSQVQGICPDGWHLPSDDEWCEMTHTLAPNSDCLDNVSYFGGDDYLARQISFPNYWVYDNFTYDGMPGFWNSSNLYFNSSEFSALPTGFYSHGSYFAVGAATYWWTASAYDSQESYCRYIQCNNKGMSRTHEETCHGFAVRCILNK